MGKFIMIRRVNGQYQFNLLAGNGKIILTSGGYAYKKTCKKGIRSVKINAQEDCQYQRKVAVDGKYFFCLQSKNGRPIGVSEMYDSLQAMDKGIKAVKMNGY